VTDDWDRRCMMNVLNDYYNDNVLNVGHLYDASGIYKQIEPTTDLEVICRLLLICGKTLLKFMFIATRVGRR